MESRKVRHQPIRFMDKMMSGAFVIGVTISVWVQPAATYSWMWNEVQETGHEFVVGLLDIRDSQFEDDWKVIAGGNRTVDLSKMIPGDTRQLTAVLKKGNTDLPFRYKIVAECKDSQKNLATGMAQKLEEVLHIRIESGKDLLYDGLVRDLHPFRPGAVVVRNSTENVLLPQESDKIFQITVYLPTEGVDKSYQNLAANLYLSFLAKQETANAIYAE